MENKREEEKKKQQQEQSPYAELYVKKDGEGKSGENDPNLKDAGAFGSAAREPGDGGKSLDDSKGDGDD